MITAPPSVPAANANDTEPSPGVATRSVGADGVVRGVNASEAADAAPLPAAFTARNFTVYSTPLVTEIVAGDEVTAGENANQLPEPFNSYS